MKILITGGNGFIGHHVVKEFLSEGYKVRVLVRKNSNTHNLKGLNVEYCYGDIRDYESLEIAFEGVEGLVHISALAKDWGSYKDFYDTNVLGVLNLLKLSKANKLKKIILTGTNSVYGEENSLIVKNEESPLNSHYKYFLDKIFPCKMNYYRDTKRIGKEKAEEYAKANNLDVIFIEPVWVYGQGEFGGAFYQYLKSAEEKIPFLPGSTQNKFHIIYVKDLAKIYLRVYKKNIKGVGSYIAGNEKAQNMEYIYGLFCKEANLRKPFNIPKIVIYPLAFLMEIFYTIFGIKNPPLLTRGRVNMFYDNIEYSVDKLIKELEFTEFTHIETGIKETVKWYKDNKYLR